MKSIAINSVVASTSCTLIH